MAKKKTCSLIEEQHTAFYDKFVQTVIGSFASSCQMMIAHIVVWHIIPDNISRPVAKYNDLNCRNSYFTITTCMKRLFFTKMTCETRRDSKCSYKIPLLVAIATNIICSTFLAYGIPNTGAVSNLESIKITLKKTMMIRNVTISVIRAQIKFMTVDLLVRNSKRVRGKNVFYPRNMQRSDDAQKYKNRSAYWLT